MGIRLKSARGCVTVPQVQVCKEPPISPLIACILLYLSRPSKHANESV